MENTTFLYNHDFFLEMMLQVHPMERPNITDIVNKLQEIASDSGICLKSSMKASKPKQHAHNNCKSYKLREL